MTPLPRIFCLAMAAMISCVSSCRHAVHYKITQEDRQITQHFPVTLRVTDFSDMAPKHPSINLTVNNQRWKTNALEVYKHKEYAKGVSRMIAEDLKDTGMFNKVLGPTDQDRASFVLRGTIWDFSGVGLWRTIPENAVIFSSILMNIPGTLISAAVLSQLKTDVVTSVILTDIKIIDLRNGKTVWECPPLRAGGNQRLSWSKADPNSLVKLVDNDLQKVVTQLVNKLNQDAPAGLRR